MKVYRSIEEFSKPDMAVVTIGTFDGVHRGHQKIINRVREIAGRTGCEAVVLTFFPHPRMVLHPGDHGLLLLSTMDEKIALMEKFGIDHFIIYPFTPAFSRTSVTEYVRDLLVNAIGTRKLVIGYDHHFGRNREGSLDDLRELSGVYGFEVEEIPEQDIHHVAVSSTKIRQALLDGDVETANEFLGHRYAVSGRVVEGNKRGRGLGFPTANIEAGENYKLVPGSGIYAVKAKLANADSWYDGALSIGVRPTFGDGPSTIEVHLLDFDAKIYGEAITVEFHHRLRDEIKFDSAAALADRMKQDVEETRRLLSSG